MIVEIAEYNAQPGKAEEFLAGLKRGMDIVRKAEGCRAVYIRRQIEDANHFIAQIEWETLEHHMVMFRGSPQFQEYRSHIAGLFVDPIVATHYATVG
ncbi:MAG: putative quinol monooxygenase [Ktedonobacterales bacterium]